MRNEEKNSLWQYAFWAVDVYFAQQVKYGTELPQGAKEYNF